MTDTTDHVKEAEKPIIIDQAPDITEEDFEEKNLAIVPDNGSTLFSLEPRSLKEVQSLALVFAQSGMFANVQDYSQAMVKIMWGRKLGFGAVESMTGIHIINNKPAVGAHMIAAGIRRNPNYDYDVEELDDQKCTIALLKNGSFFKRETFTIQDATTAELTTGKNAHTWRKYPRNMLFARCISNLQKWHCPDVFFMTVYTPEEMGMEVDQDGNPIIEGEFVVKPETRQIDHTTPQQQKRDSKPRQSAPPSKQQSTIKGTDTPWSEHIDGWDGKAWYKFRKAVEGFELTEEEAKLALGEDGTPIKSYKDFAGTHDDCIQRLVKASQHKKEGKPIVETTEPQTQPGTPFTMPEPEPEEEHGKAWTGGKVSTNGERGSFTVSRLILVDRTNEDKYDRPLIEVFALDDSSGEEDEIPAIPLRQMLNAEMTLILESGLSVPAKLGKVEGTTVYSLAKEQEKNENDPVLLMLNWERKAGSPYIVSLELLN